MNQPLIQLPQAHKIKKKEKKIKAVQKTKQNYLLDCCC
jgi:hypothetical protein